jgi:hypothetical protein
MVITLAKAKDDEVYYYSKHPWFVEEYGTKEWNKRFPYKRAAELYDDLACVVGRVNDELKEEVLIELE